MLRSRYGRLEMSRKQDLMPIFLTLYFLQNGVLFIAKYIISPIYF
jgi:hypothetical protein